MAPKRNQPSQAVGMSKGMRKSVLGSQQIPPENPILQNVEALCSHLGRLEERLGADAPLSPSHLQEQVPRDSGGGILLTRSIGPRGVQHAARGKDFVEGVP